MYPDKFDELLVKGLAIKLNDAELAGLHARYLSQVDARWVDGFRFQVE